MRHHMGRGWGPGPRAVHCAPTRPWAPCVHCAPTRLRSPCRILCTNPELAHMISRGPGSVHSALKLARLQRALHSSAY